MPWQQGDPSARASSVTTTSSTLGGALNPLRSSDNRVLHTRVACGCRPWHSGCAGRALGSVRAGSASGGPRAPSTAVIRPERPERTRRGRRHLTMTSLTAHVGKGAVREVIAGDPPDVRRRDRYPQCNSRAGDEVRHGCCRARARRSVRCAHRGEVRRIASEGWRPYATSGTRDPSNVGCSQSPWTSHTRPVSPARPDRNSAWAVGEVICAFASNVGAALRGAPAG